MLGKSQSHPVIFDFKHQLEWAMGCLDIRLKIAYGMSRYLVKDCLWHVCEHVLEEY